MFVPPEPSPQRGSGKIKKIGNPGRKRKYEEPGIDDIPPVKEVILHRHKTGKHWPGISKDMRDWYEFYYFEKPKRAEKVKDAENYERHVRSWERGRKWIAEEDASVMADSGKVIAITRRRVAD